MSIVTGIAGNVLPKIDESATKSHIFCELLGNSSHKMPISRIDDRDRAILRELMRDGRLTNAELAARVHLSPSACLRRVQLLQETGMISGYVMLADAAQIGLPGVAFVLITLDQQGRAALDAFETAAARQQEILEVYLLAGSADYLVRVAFRDAAHFEKIHTDILTQLPGVARLQTTLALRTVKKTTALPL